MSILTDRFRCSISGPKDLFDLYRSTRESSPLQDQEFDALVKEIVKNQKDFPNQYLSRLLKKPRSTVDARA